MSNPLLYLAHLSDEQVGRIFQNPLDETAWAEKPAAALPGGVDPMAMGDPAAAAAAPGGAPPAPGGAPPAPGGAPVDPMMQQAAQQAVAAAGGPAAGGPGGKGGAGDKHGQIMAGFWTVKYMLAELMRAQGLKVDPMLMAGGAPDPMTQQQANQAMGATMAGAPPVEPATTGGGASAPSPVTEAVGAVPPLPEGPLPSGAPKAAEELSFQELEDYIYGSPARLPEQRPKVAAPVLQNRLGTRLDRLRAVAATLEHLN